MTRRTHRDKFATVMWGAIGVSSLLLAVMSVYQLDTRMAGYVVGTLVVTCIVVCGVAFWLDGRTARATSHSVNQYGRKPH